jgi:hypothetical protein
MMDWHRAKYDIVIVVATRTAPLARRQEVDGIRLHDVPIGIHASDRCALDVTHIPSGKRIAAFTSLGVAMEFVERVAYLTNLWHEEHPQIDAEVQDVVTRIAAEVIA